MQERVNSLSRGGKKSKTGSRGGRSVKQFVSKVTRRARGSRKKRDEEEENRRRRNRRRFRG